MKQVVTIGGGSGHSQVLKALKDIPGIAITGICPSTDSGGSTGVLQEQYNGSGYTGDLTKCIVSLCDDATLAKALSFRYEDGPLHSHSVKNLLFHALEKVGDTEKALQTLWKVCGLGVHRIIPVTRRKTQLCASLKMGNTIHGETDIDTIAKNPLWNPDVHAIKSIFLKPPVPASPQVISAITSADLIVICPGDLYSSIIPVLLPNGMKETLCSSNVPILLILNIMTKKGETDNYQGMDFVKQIEKYVGRKVNYILCNSKAIPKSIRMRYSLEQKVELGGMLQDNRVQYAPLALITKEYQILSDPKVIKREVLRFLT